MNCIRHLLTGSDNQTHDLGRWSWAGSFLSVVGMAGWQTFQGHGPTVTELAQALGAVAAAHALALFAKQQTEPKP